jgi:hypothetical protein
MSALHDIPSGRRKFHRRCGRSLSLAHLAIRLLSEPPQYHRPLCHPHSIRRSVARQRRHCCCCHFLQPPVTYRMLVEGLRPVASRPGSVWSRPRWASEAGLRRLFGRPATLPCGWARQTRCQGWAAPNGGGEGSHDVEGAFPPAPASQDGGATPAPARGGIKAPLTRRAVLSRRLVPR